MYKKPAKRWWPCFHRIYVEFQKRGTSHSHFLAGPTFVPLWVSHKLKTNPILFFSFFSFFQKGKATEKPILLRFLRYVLRSSAWKIPLFRAKKKENRFPSKFWASIQPNVFTDGHPLLGWPCVGGVLLTPRFLFGDFHSAFRKSDPKVAIFSPFFGCREAVFFTSHWVESKSCKSWAIEVLQPVFTQCELFVKE